MQKIPCKGCKHRKAPFDITVQTITEHPQDQHCDDQERKNYRINQTEKAYHKIIPIIIDIINGIEPDYDGIDPS